MRMLISVVRPTPSPPPHYRGMKKVENKLVNGHIYINAFLSTDDTD